jgi:hypothetical protein
MLWFLSSGRGENTVQTRISIDDEKEDRCIVIVPGFHAGGVEIRGVSGIGDVLVVTRDGRAGWC